MSAKYSCPKCKYTYTAPIPVSLVQHECPGFGKRTVVLERVLAEAPQTLVAT